MPRPFVAPPARFVYPLVLIVILASLLDPNAWARFPMDPLEDQSGYLESGALCGDHLLFRWRAPVYAAWLGGLYRLTGRDLGATFYVDKVASVVLVALLSASVALALWGWRAGLLAGTLAANSKYLLSEVNGSHALAAVLFLSSLRLLLMRNARVGRPAALATLFFAAQVRQEAWLPFLIVTTVLAFQAVRRPRPAFSTRDAAPWIVAVVVCLAAVTLFRLRETGFEPHRFEETFAQNLMLTAQERGRLPATGFNPFLDWRKAWPVLFPGVDPDQPTAPIAAAIANPGQVAGHLWWNLRHLPRTLAAAVLAPRRWWVLVVVALGALALPAAREQAAAALSRGPEVALWCAAQGSILIIAIGLVAWTRYYLPFVPAVWIAIGGLAASVRSRQWM